MSEESTHRRLGLFRLNILGQAVFQTVLPECDSLEFSSVDCLSCRQNTLCHLYCNLLCFFPWERIFSTFCCDIRLFLFYRKYTDV